MAALGWLLLLGFAGGGVAVTPTVQLSVSIRARGTQAASLDTPP